MASCGSDDPVKPDVPDSPDAPDKPETPAAVVASPAAFDGNKRAGTTYQLLVYSFADSDGDGIGDFNGITKKLGYLDSLGVTAIWLSPIHPASSYHGYDVTDYYAVNPKFGTEKDFKRLIDAAHEKDIDIYLDYVLNHSSAKNTLWYSNETVETWFTQACSSTTNSYRDYYIFSKDPKNDIAAGKIDMIATEGANGYNSGQWFKVRSGSGAAGQLISDQTYWHSHFWTDWFADFNYGKASQASSSPAFKDLAKSADKWIGMGIDGMRLDAVKHIYHNESSDENPTFLAQWHEHCDSAYKAQGHSDDFFMVGEVFSEASSVARYYKGLPSCFEFSFWWRLKDALNNQVANTFPSTILGYEKLYASQRANPVESTKLSNHDEDRTATDLSKSPSKEKQACAFLLTAPGKPFIYQGEELGYYGTKTNGDEYVRTPIMWDMAGNQVASGALGGKVDKNMLTKAISVEAQNANPSSVLSVYKKFSRLRNTYPALASGSMSEHDTYNGKSACKTIACWYMTSADDSEKLLVVHNVATTGTQSLTFRDDLSKPVAVLGRATSLKNSDGTYTLNMSSNTSIVFQIK